MPKSEPLVATIDLCLSEDSQTEDLSASVNPNMQTDQEGTTSTAHKKKPEPTDSKLNVNRKSEKKGDCKDKPRIVLTFRSEKTGAKSSNMKIVSTEEKQEEISPRRSTRLGTKGESDYECDVSIKSEKTKSQSEDDTPETTTPKRSTRWRNKDSWDNVLANAIARKENYNEMPSGSVQRPSRRIKPTAKVIANQEMSESQSKLPDEGIRTRSTRSTARLSAGGSEKKASKEREDVEDMDVDNMPNPKLEHFTGLGLKAINSKDIKEDSEEDVEVEDEVETASPEGDEEEIDDDTEVINQLLEEDDTSDDDYSITEDVVEYKVRRPKRKAAQVEKEEDLPIAFRLSKRRESARASKYSKTVSGPPTEDEEEDVGDAANGEAGVEAACPADESKIAGACLCEAPSNVHAAPGDLPEPVFCQAIGMVDEVRVGCSHPAARDAAGELRALLRAGLRAPYFLACTQHVMQLRKHMCCPTCGLFCTQGTFYQCSGGHLFHLECGLGSALPAAGGGGVPGCPHCGVSAARWLPVNHAVSRVQLDMHCSNKRIFLPEQREQCTPAYLSFPTINSIAPPEGPIIPEDLIPAGFDTKLEKLLEATAENEVDDVILEQLRDSIVAGDTDELIPKIISAKPYINQPIDASGATLAHVAAKSGRLFALHALRCAGAGVDARNCSLNTPLMCAITELLESSHTESGKNKTVPKVEPVKCEESMDVDNENNSKSDPEIADDKITIAEEVKLKPSEDSVTKVPVEDDDVKEEIVKKEIVKEEIVKEEIVKEETVKEDIVEEAKEKYVDTEQKSTAIVEVKSPKSEEDVSKNLVEAKTDIDDLMKTDDVPVEEQIDEPIKKIIDKTKADELLKVIRYLVNASSDIDIAGPDGLTALHLAAEFGSARVCNIILSESAADINAKDQAGWTPLAYATENHPDVVKELLSQGADASVPDNEGSTALQWAAWTGNARCLQLLAAAPASDAPVARVPVDLDHVNVHGDTALHIAARNGFYPCVAILLAHGARTDLENSNKQLAIDEASGACRAAISLQMQLAIRRGERRVLASDISNGREPHPIPCINEVDDAELPTDFTYVTDHVMPEVVTVDHTLDTMKGCSCTDDCSSGSCECTSLSVRRWFVRGRLLPSFPHREPPMLLECNATCRCNAKRCVNSVVSNLSRSGSVFARCEVYRAGGARGWGLRTRGAVPRGAPVALYVGELLLPTAADTRSPDTYMLALDVKPDLLEECVDKRQLCVDACRYGNAARFMNHSCRPSLAVLRVLRGARDVRLPAALLVATRALPPHTALTFDYGDKFWSVKSKWISCECGELECRYNNNADE